ncbi:hypothetical protein [Sphingopyxis sp. GW247-27LB]|uniref:hypothetical protein n=1 Tax=Sphingopyxis sp. GW247-27LB TaxID=2012632 RepID=UPI000BA67135|nr:hypothetical protein [Sphingopyxis sp. GW247-27LB]PAL23565.1 hypothetical protein CD928_05725 [Sphingopyxis sp. GW247-27LB]
MADQIHKSRNVTMWKSDPQIEAARKVQGWSDFHASCGQQGLYFDDIEREGRGYRCMAFTLRRSGPDNYQRIVVARGQGRGVIDAVLACFDAALAEGFAVSVAHRALLDGSAVTAVDLDDLIGAPVSAAPELEDLIG